MWFNLIVVIVLVILSGTFAGLTLALFGIKLTTLERKIRLGDHRAEKVYRIRKKGNLLLITLLLGNVSSYTIMAIFLGSITSGVIAGFIATSLIFVFGEILPQAVFPRYALEIGAKLSWLVWILMIIFYPVTKPIAWVLDKILGNEPPVLWSKKELGEIIKHHKDVGEGIIDEDEEQIILGALSFSELKVMDIMIPLKKIFYFEPNTTVNKKLLNQIKKKGFSRVPVYDTNNRILYGVLYIKDLIGLSLKKEQKVENLINKKNLIIVNKSTRLDKLLNLMVTKKMHMAFIVDDFNFFIGLVTMEDIMEEILQMELEDKKT
jgi:metal transporter CNNM